MVFAREHIEIITTMVDNVTGASKRVTKSIQEVGNGAYRTTEQITGFNSKGQELNRTTNTVARGQHRFKMELLGVMFAGMALWRVTSGLIKAQLQLFGVNEMFGQMMTMIFLPVMTALAPILYTILEYFMNLSDPVKSAISIFIILGALLGGFLMLFGQIGLGIFSIAKAFPILAPIVKGVVAAVTGSLGLVIIVITIIVAIIIGMYIAWKENFMNMKKVVSNLVNSIKLMFGGVFKVIKGIVKFFVAIFKGDFEGAKNAVIQILTGLGEFITGLFLSLANFIGAIGIGIIRVFMGVVTKIVDFFKWLYQKLVGGSIIPDMVRKMIDWFWKLPGAIMDALKSILRGAYNWGIDFIQNIINGIKSMGRKVINAILNLFPSWMRNSIERSGTITINIIKSVTEKVRKVFSSGNRKDDFIWRPGQSPISINPRDTLVGFKGTPPNLGGKREIILNQTNYINVSDKEEMEKAIRDNNLHLVEEIKRQIAI